MLVDRYGIQGGYKFFPNPKQKIFDFHFFYDIRYYKGSLGDIVELHYLQHIIGYGFHCNIISNLYIYNNVGGGVINRELRYVDDYWPKSNSNEITGMFTIGIGYKI